MSKWTMYQVEQIHEHIIYIVLNNNNGRKSKAKQKNSLTNFSVKLYI